MCRKPPKKYPENDNHRRQRQALHTYNGLSDHPAKATALHDQCTAPEGSNCTTHRHGSWAGARFIIVATRTRRVARKVRAGPTMTLSHPLTQTRAREPLVKTPASRQPHIAHLVRYGATLGEARSRLLLPGHCYTTAARVIRAAEQPARANCVHGAAKRQTPASKLPAAHPRRHQLAAAGQRTHLPHVLTSRPYTRVAAKRTNHKAPGNPPAPWHGRINKQTGAGHTPLVSCRCCDV